MKIHRFIGDFDLKKSELEIGGEIARQIRLVLKLKVGEKIELSDGKDISAIAEIVEIKKDKVLVKKDNTTPLRSPSYAGQNTARKVILFCSILKKENFELVVQKTTECGISSIIPIITSRTVKTGLNLERLKKIAREASEQSGRITVPEISEPIQFSEAIKLAKPARNASSIASADGENNLNILFDAEGELTFEIHCAGRRSEHSKFSAENYVRISKDNSLTADMSINIWIGPEGGWTPEEIKLAKEIGFQIASLGPLTLRGETAAIIASYLISNLE